MAELPDDTPPSRRRAPRGGKRLRFVLPDDELDERVGEVIEAFLDGPPEPKGRRRSRTTPRPAVLRPTRRRPVPMDTRPDWDLALRHEDARMARYGRPASIVVIHLPLTAPGTDDRFPARVGQIVRELARETDRVTRAAADRFHVLLPETEGPDAETLLDRVRQACADRVVGRLGAEVRVVGAVASPGRGETLHDALRAAQVAVGAA
jgi:hypothetical protein